jgi:hypothetical protein
MIEKLDISDIVGDHYKSFRSYRTGKQQKRDYATFLGGPVVIALLSAYFNVLLNSTAIGVLITAVAILGGLLFNLLILIHTLKNSGKEYVSKGDTVRFFGEIYANISYSILIALFTLLPLAILVVVNNERLTLAINAIAIFLCLHLLLTLFMVLKRIHSLLRIEF